MLLMVEEYIYGCYFQHNIFLFFGEQMSREKHFIDDLTRVASGAIGAIGNVKGEVEAKFKDTIQHFLDDMDYVPRDEFDVVRDMAQKAREQNLMLEEKIRLLESKIDSLSKLLTGFVLI